MEYEFHDAEFAVLYSKAAAEILPGKVNFTVAVDEVILLVDKLLAAVQLATVVEVEKLYSEV